MYDITVYRGSKEVGFFSREEPLTHQEECAIMSEYPGAWIDVSRRTINFNSDTMCVWNEELV